MKVSINIDKENSDFQHNPELKQIVKELNDTSSLTLSLLNDVYYLKKFNDHISFYHIMNACEKVYNPENKSILVVLPFEDIGNLLVDMAALRIYDSSYQEKEVDINTIYLNYHSAKVAIKGMDNVGKGYLFTFNDETVYKVTSTTVIGDVTITQNKDFSIVPIKYKSVLRFQENG